MVNTVILKSSNIVDTTKNSTFEYPFPNSIKFENMEVALISASLYYTWFNISDELNNRKFQYKYYNGAGEQVVDVELDEGLYEISDMNKALQYSFIDEGLYLIDSNGDYVYYAEFIANNVRNSVDINTYPIPRSLPNNYSQPTTTTGLGDNGPGFPTDSHRPNIILSSNFNEILGYDANFNTEESFPTTSLLSQTVSSTKAPNVNPNSSVLVEINIVDNPYGNPANIIYAIVPNVSVGSLIYVNPAEYAFVPIKDGVYNNLRLRLLNKDTLQPLTIQDGQITMILGIQERKKYNNQALPVAGGGRYR